MTEEWRNVPGFASYEVSNLGQLRRLHKTRYPSVLVPYRAKRGKYLVFSLRVDGTTKLVRLNRLVALAFHGEPPFLGADARHLDGDKENNYATNIAWGSRTDNEADKVRHGTSNQGERHGMAKLTNEQVRELVRRYRNGENPVTLAAEFKVNKSYPASVARGTRRTS